MTDRPGPVAPTGPDGGRAAPTGPAAARVAPTGPAAQVAPTGPAAQAGLTGQAGHTAGGAAQAGVVNIANVLTIMRLALVPVFVAFLFAGDGDGWRVAAFAAYAVAATTDQVDGYIARRRGIVTEFGAFVDPVADKALTGSALVSLSLLDELAWAVTAVVILREVGITAIRLWVIRHGVIAASRGGKMKTLSLNVAVGLYVLPLTGAAASARAVLLAVGVTLAVATGADYVARALALRRRAPAAGDRRDDAGATAPSGTATGKC
jgi:CDP-diacylglycerol--glycerol-3-phosphate 3-phosphatidyltransferase